MEYKKFPWNDSQLVLNQYKKDNIKIEKTGVTTGKAIIFFSSNGIYFPNTEECFSKKIIDRNRYEFENISRDKRIQKEYELIIFIRDIYKQWCVNGINENINSIDKLYEYLHELTSGYQLTTCGSSAGGYLSMLLGSMLKADKIFSFSGQFYLWDEINISPLLRENQFVESKSRYYDISKIISGGGYYIYPAKSPKDIFQHSFVKDNDKIKKISVDQEQHGSTIDPECYAYLLTMRKDDLEKFFEKFKDVNLVTRKQINAKLLPLFKRIKCRAKGLAKKVLKKIKR